MNRALQNYEGMIDGSLPTVLPSLACAGKPS
jgi:hypothetical protein